MSIVCLGEALVDLIGEPAGESPRHYGVYPGGALANVAVAIARAGGPAALAGGSGSDQFGDYLRRRLEREGVDLRHLHRIPELVTPFAFVDLEPGGEPRFRIHGDGIEAGLGALAGTEDELVAEADALVIGSNTLVADPGLTVTLSAVEAARRAEVPVLFDPNLRPGRWKQLDSALELCRELAAGCLLLKTNLAEARMLAGDPSLDAAAAASRLVELGTRLVVVTAGSSPAIVRGEVTAQCPPIAVSDPQPLGAGDAFMGTLVAGMYAGDWAPESVESSLSSAVAAGAEACTRVGATN